MQTPTFTIGGATVPFEAAWVQLKPRPHEPTGYELCVPRSLWLDVFDPDAERRESQNWSEFLKLEVEEYGFVDLWLSVLSEYFPSEVDHWEWVIATVDQITEHSDHIQITGRAERFEPGRYPPLVLRPLE
jgi:hypothetical protein